MVSSGWAQMVIYSHSGMNWTTSTLLGKASIVLGYAICFFYSDIIYTCTSNNLLVWLNMAYMASHTNSIHL
ncbi:hypothetical protein BCR42DRAFT_419022 [Absidia repens]|uniref:Uncharacterized protein n=1 Tax=Absidia repens TaxID=90262 RepID=A0A1X2IAS8_9FUNG|nr:hypothetical protein BCR42DRAFT_419022 [Absidia repens]